MHKATGFALTADHKPQWGQEEHCHQTRNTSTEGSNFDKNQNKTRGRGRNQKTKVNPNLQKGLTENT